jgi:hypothetical protein
MPWDLVDLLGPLITCVPICGLRSAICASLSSLYSSCFSLCCPNRRWSIWCTRARSASSQGNRARSPPPPWVFGVGCQWERRRRRPATGPSQRAKCFHSLAREPRGAGGRCGDAGAAAGLSYASCRSDSIYWYFASRGDQTHLKRRSNLQARRSSPYPVLCLSTHHICWAG